MHIHMHVMHGRSPSSKSGWEVLLRPLLRKRPTLRAALLAEGDAAPYGAAAGPMAPMAPVGFPGASGMQGPWQPGERCLVWSNSAQRWCDLVNWPGRLCQTDFFWTKGSLRFCVFAGWWFCGLRDASARHEHSMYNWLLLAHVPTISQICLESVDIRTHACTQIHTPTYPPTAHRHTCNQEHEHTFRL